jgi:hypothetical protein
MFIVNIFNILVSSNEGVFSTLFDLSMLDLSMGPPLLNLFFNLAEVEAEIEEDEEPVVEDDTLPFSFPALFISFIALRKVLFFPLKLIVVEND